jgi:hypothetical protein
MSQLRPPISAVFSYRELRIVVGALGLLLLLGGPVRAQSYSGETPRPPGSGSGNRTGYRDGGVVLSLPDESRSTTSVPTTPAKSNPGDPKLAAAERDYQLAQYQYWTRLMDQRLGIIDTTNRLGFVIFGVVHLLVAVGLVMSWREFRRAETLRQRSGEGERDTELKVSLEGLALKTSLHGGVLLGFALAFYFLYLRFVYPISVVPSQ